MSNDDRIAYLAGDIHAPLPPAARAELDELLDVLTDPAVWAEPDPALEDRIVAAVLEATAGSEATEPSRTAAEVAAPAVVPTRGRAEPRRRSRWIRYGILGVAAAALLGVGLAIGLASGSSGSRPVEFAAALNGTIRAPHATGEVTLTKTTSGWKVHLQTSGLPRRSDEEFYEAWLKNRKGELVAIGTFNQADDVTLWSGVPPREYNTVTITLELDDGNPSSSGQVVVVGPTHRTH
ncbi:MAG: hypothetical protein JWR06_3018 [Jatrophihabitans sp.]|nr:hypothetical protein [Jatrophihabitans sp.]